MTASRYVVHPFVLESGERFAVVMHSETGTPPTVALRFLLRERNRGGSARLLRFARRLTELYEWHDAEFSMHFDQRLFSNELPSGVELVAALNDIGAIEGQESVGLRNQRIGAWSAFVRFIARPDLWRTGLTIRESHRLRESLEESSEAAVADLKAEARPLPMPNHHDALSNAELDAIDVAIASGSQHSPYIGRSLIRARSMYYTLRFAGIRISELLKLRFQDLPSPESVAERTVRNFIGDARRLASTRLPDDVHDPRRYEPRVKRGSREIDLPDFAVAELDAYVAASPKLGCEYVFRTLSGDRPLSISRTEKIIKKIGTAATRVLIESRPGEPHTLDRFSSHRLRATRATELLPVFFKELQWTPLDEDDYLAFFGWSDRKYAEPYLSKLHRANARKKIQEHHESLRASL